MIKRYVCEWEGMSAIYEGSTASRARYACYLDIKMYWPCRLIEIKVRRDYSLEPPAVNYRSAR